MALTIDGSGATAIASGTSSVAATITTPSTNDIILAFVHCENPSGTRTVSNVSGGGLTWARRKQWANLAGPWTVIECWWAAAVSPLTSQTITATFSGAIDDCSLQLVAVHGVLNLASPWDVNSSLPVAAAGPGSGVSVPVSTSSASTILFGFDGEATANVPATGTGFTALYTTANGGGANWSYTKSQYQVFASVQTGYLATFGAVQASGAYMFDALAAVAAGPPPVELAGGLDAFAPLFAADLTIAPVANLAGDFAPTIVLAADLDVHVSLIDLGGDIAPQIALGGSLSFDLVLEGSFDFSVVYGASSLVSGLLWADSDPCSPPPWGPSDLCPPPPWMTLASCDSVVWGKSRM